MKKLVCFVFAFASVMTSFAQNAKEIVSKMEESFAARCQEGVSFNSKWSVSVVNGRTTRLVANMSGESEPEMLKEAVGDIDFLTSSVSMLEDRTCEVFPDRTMYDDGNTIWKYSASNNEIGIYNKATYGSKSPCYVDFLSDIKKNYNLSIVDETDDLWVIACKCKPVDRYLGDGRDLELTVCKDTFDPETLVIRDKDYYITLTDFNYGVTEDQVTFHPAEYLAATFSDNR